MKSKIEDDKIYTSKSLTEEMNEERIRQGKDELPEINPLRGGTSTLARKDKSWSSVPDFLQRFSRRNKSKACAATFDLVKSSYTVSDV